MQGRDYSHQRKVFQGFPSLSGEYVVVIISYSVQACYLLKTLKGELVQMNLKYEQKQKDVLELERRSEEVMTQPI